MAARAAERIAALQRRRLGVGRVRRGQHRRNISRPRSSPISARLARHPGHPGDRQPRGDHRGLERNEFDLSMMGRPPAHIEVESGHARRPSLCSDRAAGPSPRRRRRHPGRGPAARALPRARARLRHPHADGAVPGAASAAARAFEVVEMGTNETIKQSVMAGLGIAIISAHTCLTEIADGQLITLAGHRPAAGAAMVPAPSPGSRIEQRRAKVS